MFTLTINTDNAAFKDPYNGKDNEYYEAIEIVRIIRDAFSDQDDLVFPTSRKLRDINGNVVGEWIWK